MKCVIKLGADETWAVLLFEKDLFTFVSSKGVREI
jgi:hypothetical protein